MNAKRILVSILLSAAIISVVGFNVIDDPIARIIRQLNKWTSGHPVEKVHLQLDKPYYAAGDDIWFKAYVVAGPEQRPTSISGIINVDLIDASDKLTRSLKLQLSNGTAAGDIALPDTLPGGYYRLRAYTNNMRNAGPEYYFDRVITVLSGMASKAPDGKLSGKVTMAPAATSRADVQFFPEGGYMVSGVPSRVAFKAVGPNGLGVDVTGMINDDQGKQVATISGSHFGMGRFDLAPQAGRTYTARLSTASGQQLTVSLPKAQERGYVLSINDQGDDLIADIKASRAILNGANSPALTLIGQTRGKIYFTQTVKPGNIRIAKNTFPDGVAQFTLFTNDGVPIAERLAFVAGSPKLQINIDAAQRYAPRQKMKLDLSVADHTGQPVAGNFSVAVTDETKVPVNEDAENNILANLLLTSDLKGYVEQPAYYFNHMGDKVRADLDVLMMTQGYRRFDWNDILQDKFAANVYAPEKALRISGTITGTDGKPVANGKVEVIDIDNIDYKLDTLTDAAGRFSFDNLAFNDSIRLIVQARTAKNKKDIRIDLDSIAPPPYSINKNRPDLSIDIRDSLAVYDRSSRALYALQRQYGVGNHVIPLREVIIREKKQALKGSANLNGAGNADQVILARDLRNYGCIYLSDCLQGRLLGVVFRNGVPFTTRGFRPMQVILDGVYVEGSFLNSINYNDVQAIEVLRNIGSTAIYGSRGGNGVLIVTTKRGGDDNYYDGPITGRGIKFFTPKGYYATRTFYSPRYDAPKENKQLADLRTTIYWNPNLVTGADGKTSIQYFNAGSKGTYRMVIEGIDNNGNIARRVLRYTVQ